MADGVDGVTAKVRENIKYGADVIKFMATGGVLSEGDNPALEQYSPEEMKAIVDTAHGLGRKVAAHAHGALGIKNAVLAGVDSIEHGSYMNEEDIQLMKQHGTYLVPTLYLGDWLMENLSTLGLTPNMIEKAKIVLPIARQNIAIAFKSGVKVAFRHRCSCLSSWLERARICGDGEARSFAVANHPSCHRECCRLAWLDRSDRHA